MKNNLYVQSVQYIFNYMKTKFCNYNNIKNSAQADEGQALLVWHKGLSIYNVSLILAISDTHPRTR